MLTDNQRGMKADAKSIGTTSAKLFSMIEEVGLDGNKAANKDAESLSLDDLAKSDVWSLKSLAATDYDKLQMDSTIVFCVWNLEKRHESNC
jgi:hypothetical protein